ncbi:MAG: DNA translocase FtsK [Syntrophobacteraceae bacterium]
MSVIAAVAIAPWSRWAALALAGFGIVVGVPHWFKRSWRDVLKSFDLLPARPGDAAPPPDYPKRAMRDETVAVSAKATRRSAPEGRLRIGGASPKAAARPEYTFDAWTFQANRVKSPEPTLLPQNSIRLAADMAAARPVNREEPPADGSNEVIDRSSILEDFEKRYRNKRIAPKVEETRKVSGPVLSGSMEELRRRFAAAGGGELPGGAGEGEKVAEDPVASVSRSERGDLPTAPLIPARSPDGQNTSLCDHRAPALPPDRLKEEKPPGRGKVLLHRTPVRGVVGRKPAARPEEPGAASSAHNFSGGPFGPDFCLPPLSLLRPADTEVSPVSQDDLIDQGILIEEKLAEFRVKVTVQDAYAGPVITRYEVQPAVGVRGGQVVSLMKDLARVLGVAAIRVVETIPGKTCMGLELPNPERQMIRLSEVFSSESFRSHGSKLAMALGKDIIGEPVVADLAKAPHMLVAGTTGSGKSVGLNAMILSLLYRATPDEVRFVMIDPKMLELSIYDGIPHLLAPVVTDMKLAANALNWCVLEMDRRYRLMNTLHVRNLAGYNQKVQEAVSCGQVLVDPAAQESEAVLSPLPYIVVVIDELADLMMVAGKKIEELIARLAQKARAAGIHLIVATQRPSVDVITGLIKANIPTRIAFQVSSRIDSRTILDQMGAECLLGQGDMLYLPPGSGYPLRVHGAFVADEEVQAVAEHLKFSGEPRYLEEVLSGPAEASEDSAADSDRLAAEDDPLYDEAVSFVISSRRASISAVQRHLRIGYNRAARMIEQMEACGLVSQMENNGNRTVLVPARQE